MSLELIEELDNCMTLIDSAPIKQETRAHMHKQASVYSMFLNELEGGRLKPEMDQVDTVSSMKELISVFCQQIREILGAQAA